MAASFNQVAEFIGAIGSPNGWECPQCNHTHSVKSRKDGQGARCANCKVGFSPARYVSKIENISINQAFKIVDQVTSGADSNANQAGLL